MAKFYRTIIQVEVLSEGGPVPEGMSLADIDYQITDGDWSGDTVIKKAEEVSGEEMSKLLMKQGSDPSFFGLDEKGKPVEM